MSDLLLSFCVPVMNRLSDIQATLRKNLDDNFNDRLQIEFIVVCFDKDDKTQKWIKDNFQEELASGYLRFYQSDRLDSWHFGKAKNSFREHIKGKIYASLDGDNFTGPSGGRHIIEVFEANNFDCVFHQFQGEWGDGTCGRVSMPTEDYLSIGYDDHFLPRQWDELDALLSILVRHPSRCYVCYQGKSIARKSQPFARFLSENKIQIKTIELDPNRDPLKRTTTSVAVGQNNNNYVQEDERLKYASIFNHLSSFFKNTTNDDLRNRYVAELVDVQRTMAERLDTGLLLNWFLVPTRSAEPRLVSGDIALTACIRNETHLEEWLDHYRELGVTHFLLVDDGSTHPIAQRVPDKDVWIWTPKCGRFRYSKALWLELLLRRYACGIWAITADSDEYLDLHPKTDLSSQATTPLQVFTERASKQNIRYFAGFLLDLVPGPESLPAIRAGELLPRSAFNRYQFRPSGAPNAYRNHNTVKWSYGEYADWAYRIDVRYRLNRSFDSLRKFSLFRMDSDIHLNQGFHDLIISKQKREYKEMARSDLLVVRHYKIFNTQLDAVAQHMRPLNSYHQETQVNLERLRRSISKSLCEAAMSPFIYKYCNDQILLPSDSLKEER